MDYGSGWRPADLDGPAGRCIVDQVKRGLFGEKVSVNVLRKYLCGAAFDFSVSETCRGGGAEVVAKQERVALVEAVCVG